MMNNIPTKEAIVKPGAKNNTIVLGVKLCSYKEASIWHISIHKGKRIFNPGIWIEKQIKPFSRAKENIFYNRWNEVYKSESEINKEGKFFVIDEVVCNLPRVVMKYTDGSNKEVEFTTFEEAEKKYKEVIRKYHLVEKVL